MFMQHDQNFGVQRYESSKVSEIPTVDEELGEGEHSQKT